MVNQRGFHCIDLKLGTRPILQSQYSSDTQHRYLIKGQLFATKVIEPEQSNSAVLIVTLAKKYVTYQFCVYCRKWNEVNIPASYHIPHMEDYIDRLGDLTV